MTALTLPASTYALDTGLPVIEITATARDKIINTILQDDRRALENGGALLGSVFAQQSITASTSDLGPSMARRRHTLTFNAKELAAIAGNTGNTVLGSWHTHPEGGNQLSRGDVTSARRNLKENYRPLRAWLEIIVTPDDPRNRTSARAWRTPTLTAWLIRDGFAGYKRATLKITGETAPRLPGLARSAPGLAPASTTGWFQATSRFTGRDGADPITIALGEFVAAGHPLVRDYPQHFKPVRRTKSRRHR